MTLTPTQRGAAARATGFGLTFYPSVLMIAVTAVNLIRHLVVG